MVTNAEAIRARRHSGLIARSRNGLRIPEANFWRRCPIPIFASFNSNQKMPDMKFWVNFMIPAKV
jgi:hypothetical protein